LEFSLKIVNKYKKICVVEKLLVDYMKIGGLTIWLEDMVSFRNLLVHRYGKVDDSRAYHS